MPSAAANGVQIEYETFGKKSDSALLLIMGLGAQMIFWDEQFCRQLAGRGHYVIRFDNRDIGLSSKLDSAGLPDLWAAMQASLQGQKVDSPYTLDDMADDSVGLLDALGLQKAHICGASMGGMIAQTIAIRHPKRVLSITSIMSTTGAPDLPRAKPDVMSLLITPPPVDREGSIKHGLNVWRIISGPGYPFDEDWTRKRVALSFDRCFYPVGIGRQLMAILAHSDRTAALGKVTAPALVIHGALDPLVPVECGRATARAIPGAKLLILEKMGHSLPPQAWPQIVDAIAEHTRGTGKSEG